MADAARKRPWRSRMDVRAGQLGLDFSLAGLCHVFIHSTSTPMASGLLAHPADHHADGLLDDSYAVSYIIVLIHFYTDLSAL